MRGTEENNFGTPQLFFALFLVLSVPHMLYYSLKNISLLMPIFAL